MKQKIAILGGGFGAMTVAYQLTNDPAWQDRFEVTVYQMGWRLGGKWATGRGAQGEIFEHGVHFFLGFYNNAFRMVQAVYAEINRPPEAPIARWQDGFAPQSFVVFPEQVDGAWKNWSFDFPSNTRTPGDHDGPLTLWDYLVEGFGLISSEFLKHSEKHESLQSSPEVPEGLIARLVGTVERDVLDIARFTASGLAFAAFELARLLRSRTAEGQEVDHMVLYSLADHLHRWVGSRASDVILEDGLRRFLLIADLALATAKGLLSDVVGSEENGYDELDRFEFRGWLQSHGASEEAVLASPIRGVYDLFFSFENGEIERPSIGAGTAVRSILRIGLGYKGSIFWKMNAGTGEVIFAPMYEVLKKRGVRFEFFSQVENLGLSPDSSSVQTISIGRQAIPIGGAYDPLIDVDGLPCWPSLPKYELLADGGRLRAQGADLESFWNHRAPAEEIELRAGTDFDQVVLGISIGSFPYVCAELLEASRAWREMCDKVQTVSTMAMQWWFKPSLSELGWNLPSPVIDAYAEPMDTWADMSSVLAREPWKGAEKPKALAYFCGPLRGGVADRDDVDAPTRALKEVKAVGEEYSRRHAGFLWPAAAPAGNPGGLDTSMLVGGLEGQYYRANIDPSERYVLSIPGSTSARLKPDQSGFSNLFLAGDWTYNALNVGCVEAAVMSGMACADAIAKRAHSDVGA